MLKARLIRWIIWTVIVSAVVFELGENLWALLAPPPPLQISPATTWIIEPLAPDGLPDYFRAMLMLEPRAIPAESNAAAAVWELIPTTISSDNAIDHSPAHLSAADQVLACERLVMPPPPPDGMEPEEVESILETCARFPWRAADHPWLARWLDDNSAALDRLAAGARREGWCPPRCLPADRSPTDRFGPTTPLLMSLTLPVEGALRSFSNVLLARSMRRLGEGDIPGAWHDIDTLLRYGDKIADSPGPLICRMVAMTLFARAAHATRIVILDGNLDDALLADMQRSLHSAIDWGSQDSNTHSTTTIVPMRRSSSPTAPRPSSGIASRRASRRRASPTSSRRFSPKFPSIRSPIHRSATGSRTGAGRSGAARFLKTTPSMISSSAGRQPIRQRCRQSPDSTPPLTARRQTETRAAPARSPSFPLRRRRSRSRGRIPPSRPCRSLRARASPLGCSGSPSACRP